MKRIGAVLFMVLLLSGMSFAAASRYITEAGRIGVGIYGTTPVVRYNFTEQFNGMIGADIITSDGNNRAGQFGLLLAGALNMYEFGDNKLYAGGRVNYSSNSSNIPGDSTFSIGLTCGVETMVNSFLSAGFVITPFSISSTVTANTSSTHLGILSSGAVTLTYYL